MMTGAGWMLLLIGAVFMVGSFFITEKLSPSELNKLAELSEDELKRIIERELKNAEMRIDEQIVSQLDASMELVERALEKETNSKIMAINEYSDTVLENINKAHNEIMFLYSMLNDKHTELTSLVSDLQRLAADVRDMEETYHTQAPVQQAQTVSAVSQIPTVQLQSAMQQTAGKAAQSVTAVQTSEAVHTTQAVPPAALTEQPVPAEAAPAEAAGIELELQEFAEDTGYANVQQQILAMHRDGMSEIQIAKNLKMGVGEVKLVIGINRGE